MKTTTIKTKKCSRCNKRKFLKLFHKDCHTKLGVQSYCIQCASIVGKQYTKHHYEKRKAHSIKKRIRFSNFIYWYYKEHPCVDCGNNDPRALQMDHVRGVKRCNVASMRFHSMKSILKEIAKCDVRCANCHSIKTAEEQGWYKDVSKR